MGRPPSQSVPADIALLCVIELGLSFVVLQLMLATPYISMPFAAGAINLIRPGENLAAVIAAFIGLVTIVIGLYHPEIRLNRAKLLGAAGVAGLVAFPLFLIMSAMYVEGSTAARSLWLVRILGVWLVTIVLFRLAFSFVIRPAVASRRLLVLGEPDRVAALADRLNCRRGRRFEVLVPVRQWSTHAGVEAVSSDALSMARLRQQRIWGVVFAADGSHPLAGGLLDLKLRGVKVLNDQVFQEQHLGRIDLSGLTLDDLLFGAGFASDTISRLAKRACDITVSLALLIMTLPLMVITALAIKLDSPGPIFYRQQRTGHFGRSFTLLKFRSMAVDAEAEGAPRWAQKHDPRITRVGAFIRSTRVDELPQLANVLTGEMSLVGPRPERPHFVEQLAVAIPFYKERNYVKPGVTGWAQVNFPYGASVEDAREKLTYDLYYVKHRGLSLDIRILLATVRVVLFREGAR